MIAMPNATNEFQASVMAGFASNESPAPIKYIWNEVRWVTVAESYVLPSMEQAVSQASKCYLIQHAAEFLSNGSLSQNSTQALLNGPQASSDNTHKFEVGIRPFLNTVGMVLPILVEFFFSMAIGGISGFSEWYRPDAVRSRYLNRLGLSLSLSCLIEISWGLWLEVYHENMQITGGQYCLIWLIYWFYGFIAFEVLDTISGWVPLPILPLFVLSYIIINVGASVFPIDIKPAFYHLDYIWPSYNCFELLITVLSKGRPVGFIETCPFFLGGFLFGCH